MVSQCVSLLCCGSRGGLIDWCGCRSLRCPNRFRVVLIIERENGLMVKSNRRKYSDECKAEAVELVLETKRALHRSVALDSPRCVVVLS